MKKYFFIFLLIVFFCLENMCSIREKYNKEISSLKNNFSLLDTWFHNSSNNLKKGIFFIPTVLSLTPMILYKISKMYENDQKKNESRIQNTINYISYSYSNISIDDEDEEGNASAENITLKFEEINKKLQLCINPNKKNSPMAINKDINNNLKEIREELKNIKSETNKNYINNAVRDIENLMDGLLLKTNSFRNWFGLKKFLKGFSSNQYINELTKLTDSYPKAAHVWQFLLSSGLAYQGLKKLKSFNFDQANRKARNTFRKKLDMIEFGNNASDVMGDTELIKRYHKYLDEKASNNEIYGEVKKLINERKYRKLREKIDDSFTWKDLFRFSQDFGEVKKDLLPEFNYIKKKNGKKRPSKKPIHEDLYQVFLLSSNKEGYNFPFEYVRKNQ